MKLTLNDERIVIERNRTVALADARDVEIVCLSGCLWLTEDRLLEDHILQTGESRTIRNRGRVLVTALESSSMRALEPMHRRRESTVRRLRLALQAFATMGARDLARHAGSGSTR
jgi:hypothetical protein